MKNYIILFFSVILILITVYQTNHKFTNSSYSLYFNEFIQSSDFSQLLKDSSHTFNYRVNGGTYNLGMPISPTNESVYGTNRGLRIVPLIFLFTALQTIFHQWWDRIYFLFILVLPVILYWFSLQYFSIKTTNANKVMSTLFFAFNPWVFYRLESGFWQLHIAYACIPFVYFAFMSFIDKKKRAQEKLTIILTIILTSIMYQSQPHFLIMVAVCIGISYAYFISLNIKKPIFRPLFVRLALVGIGFLGVNAYQIIPSLIYHPFLITIPGQYFSLSSVRFNGLGSTLIDIIRLSPRSALHMDIIMTKLDWLKYFFITFAVVYTGIEWRLRTLKKIRFDDFSIVISIIIFTFLAKGINEPFSEVSKFIYQHVGLMHFFRDPTRFYGIIIFLFSLSLLKSLRINYINKLLISPFYICFIVFIIFASRHLGRTIDFISLPTKYDEIQTPVEEGKLLLIPNNTSLLSYKWFDGVNGGVNNSPLEALSPLSYPLANFSGSVDNYFAQLNYYSQNQLKEKKNFDQLLNKLSMRYVLIDTDLTSSIDHDNATSSAELISKTYRLKSKQHNLELYERKKEVSLFSVTPPVFLIGNLNDFTNVSSILPSSTPLIFLNQPENITEFIDKKIHHREVTYRDMDDVKTLFLSSLSKYSVHLEKVVWHGIDKPWNVYEPYLTSQIVKGIVPMSGRSIGSNIANGSFNFTHNTRKGSYIIALKSLKEDPQGSISVSINNHVYTIKNDDVDVHWSVIGRLKLSEKNIITITNNDPSLAIIDDLLFIPENEYINTKKKYESAINSNTLIKINEYKSSLNKQKPVFTDYNQLSYATWNISSKEEWITMNFPYDYGWEITRQKARFIGNYYGMTFLADNKPTKEIAYKPETLFMYMMGVSVVTTTGLILLCFALRKKK